MKLIKKMTHSQTCRGAQFRIFTASGTGLKFRKGVRNRQLIIDKELTEIGFNGIENTDWVNVKTVNLSKTE